MSVHPSVMFMYGIKISINILMVDSTKVLCPLFNKIEIFIPGIKIDDMPDNFPIFGQNVKF